MKRSKPPRPGRSAKSSTEGASRRSVVDTKPKHLGALLKGKKNGLVKIEDFGTRSRLFVKLQNGLVTGFVLEDSSGSHFTPYTTTEDRPGDSTGPVGGGFGGGTAGGSGHHDPIPPGGQVPI